MRPVALRLHIDCAPVAEEFLAYLDSNWQVLEKPTFRHPRREELRQADEALTKLRNFVNDPTTPTNLVQQAKMYESDIKQHAAFLADLQHTFSFVGNIMVGKTLALCAIAGLLIEGPKTLKQRAALEIGGGWTTLCEVQIAAKDFGSDEVKKFGLVVYPHSHEEIWRLVSDVCVSLFAIKEGKESESRVAGAKLTVGGFVLTKEFHLAKTSGDLPAAADPYEHSLEQFFAEVLSSIQELRAPWKRAQISFVFDQSDKLEWRRAVNDCFARYKAKYPTFAAVSFTDKKSHLPLQAADMVAFRSRRIASQWVEGGPDGEGFVDDREFTERLFRSIFVHFHQDKDEWYRAYMAGTLSYDYFRKHG